MAKPLIEIACFSIEAAEIAQNAGATRIEFCVDKSVGGITPPYELLREARKRIQIPLFVMIRPRAGNFLYNDIEFAEMQNAISFCKEIGIDGVVWGILKEDRTINIVQNQQLIALASPLSCTFHRAFDEIPNKSEALEQLIQMGFQNVLTSGGEGNAVDFLVELKNLVQQAVNRICIMAGGGIRSHNISHIYQQTKVIALHSAAILTGDLPDAVEIRKLIAIKEI